MHALDAGLGRSAETAASKMRYQMNRLRRLAANFQLRRKPLWVAMQRRLHERSSRGRTRTDHGAAYYLARYGFELSEQLVTTAEKLCPGHAILSL